MPTYLDFNSTKGLRNLLLSKTINRPNGPQTFSENNYEYKNQSDFPNIDLPDVDHDREERLDIHRKTNTFKPLEYLVIEEFDVLPRKANLALYWDGTPYFNAGTHNLVSIFSNENYETESELFKLSASYIKNDPNGPIQARIKQNLESSTIGRFRLIDALNGNTATAINIITGREPLIESNNKITVAKTAIGKGIDFLQTVSGTELPFSEIPGDYLSNPRNPINQRPEANTEFGRIIQDTTGALGSLIGINRRPKLDRKPSDLMIEYLGDGQKNVLFDLLSYSRYAPNYTTTARSQNSSKLFNVVDQFSQGVNTLIGNEAPRGIAYIGDDRGEDVKYAMNDFNDRAVRSSYYLSLMFDPIQTTLFERTKNLTENGDISGKLTWISRNSKNVLGIKNNEWGTQSYTILDSLSSNYSFRSDSILGVTQELLDMMPSDGGTARSHVANVIDQTSRIFREGTKLLSRGSAIKFVNEYGNETGAEFCRVWTKDRAYLNYSDTMRRTGTLRKYDDSVLSTPWNLNIAPMSNGSRDFSSSTNIDDKELNAKKYMFSIENLAWKASTTPGFTYNDLPVCERGPNGGRVMWFPPYELKFSEQNNARWETNDILGRPEPIYTYKNTERSGQVSFKVVVDHPSILNLLVREFFKDMSDDESENYINAFFAGCEEIDFYDLINRYPIIDSNDANIVMKYLNSGTDTDIINNSLPEKIDIVEDEPVITESQTDEFKTVLYFPNDIPVTTSVNEITSLISYSEIFQSSFNSDDYIDRSLSNLETVLNEIFTTDLRDTISDRFVLTGKREQPTVDEKNDFIAEQKRQLEVIFDTNIFNYGEFTEKIKSLKDKIVNEKTNKIKITIASSTSAVSDNDYNINLSIRRTHSIIKDVLNALKGTPDAIDDKFSTLSLQPSSNGKIDINLTYSYKELGYDYFNGEVEIKAINYGENSFFNGTDCSQDKFKYKSTIGTLITSLTVTSPLSFGCRRSEFKIESFSTDDTVKNDLLTKDALSSKSPLSTVDETINKRPNTASKRELLNPMKKIITKTLSECYYFKKLEESDPVVFSSLKEKLKYFHPGFHSTTPEGLNSRLTFLQQCVRAGDTISVKGETDINQINARNTSFGPPPICVLRIGDFYNTKVVIRDLNITFDDATWDLNPEGIGVQPMIANVTLQLAFIGGQGLREPVSRLQNALSSNFYANTEMYDERSINTISDSTISNIEKSLLTKEFLDEIQKSQPKLREEEKFEDGNTKINGPYIGNIDGNSASFGILINDLYSSTNNYFSLYEKMYNNIVMEYGYELSSILLHPNYRTVTEFDLKTTPSTNTTIHFVGEYTLGDNLSKFIVVLKNEILKNIDNVNMIELLGLNKLIKVNLQNKTNRYITPIVKTIINEKLDSLISKIDVNFIAERNKILNTLDKFNFIIENEYNAKIDGEIVTKGNMSGFTYDLLYDEYSPLINKFNNYSALTNGDLNPTSINFYNPQLTYQQLKDIVSILIKDGVSKIVSILTNDKTLYDLNLINKIKNKLDKFVENDIRVKDFNFKEIKRKNNKIVSFLITEESLTDVDVIDDLKLLNDTKPRKIINNKLNNFVVI